MINPIEAIKHEVEEIANKNWRQTTMMERKEFETNMEQLLENYKAQLDKANNIVQDILKGLQRETEKRASIFNDCIQIMKAIEVEEMQRVLKNTENTKGDF